MLALFQEGVTKALQSMHDARDIQSAPDKFPAPRPLPLLPQPRASNLKFGAPPCLQKMTKPSTSPGKVPTNGENGPTTASNKLLLQAPRRTKVERYGSCCKFLQCLKKTQNIPLLGFTGMRKYQTACSSLGVLPGK